MTPRRQREPTFPHHRGDHRGHCPPCRVQAHAVLQPTSVSAEPWGLTPLPAMPDALPPASVALQFPTASSLSLCSLFAAANPTPGVSHAVHTRLGGPQLAVEVGDARPACSLSGATEGRLQAHLKQGCHTHSPLCSRGMAGGWDAPGAQTWSLAQQPPSVTSVMHANHPLTRPAPACDSVQKQKSGSWWHAQRARCTAQGLCGDLWCIWPQKARGRLVLRRALRHTLRQAIWVIIIEQGELIVCELCF